MKHEWNKNNNTSMVVFKIIFFICAIYFFIMGAALIFIPQLLIKGISGDYANPTSIGMLRGAGGSIIPYSLLYILIALNPLKRMWALYIIFTANVTAIVLDIGSVIIGEYKLSYVMYDIPIEILSIIGIIIIWMLSRRTIKLKI
jgi:hypothetical protein